LRDYNRQHQRANAESRKAANARWREKNREAIRMKARAEYAAGPEKREQNRKYREGNRPHVLATHKAWREKNAATFVPKRRANTRKYAARKQGAKVLDFTAAQLRERLSMFGHRCWMCRGPANEMDHVIPISRGGLHVLANLRPACRSCNAAKGARRFTATGGRNVAV
jgi:5-methylcytosine-specific restriction endonuclease McrA